jgi:hypothetical protein
VIPELAERTVGIGPGQKFELLNRLVEVRPFDPASYVVVADDDVVLGRRGLATMVDLMQRGGIGLAMPAQSAASHVSYGLNVRRPANRATLVPFVEIGPLFVVSPEWSSRIVPFPSDMAMGWGLDVRWSKLADEGCRLAHHRCLHDVSLPSSGLDVQPRSGAVAVGEGIGGPWTEDPRRNPRPPDAMAAVGKTTPLDPRRRSRWRVPGQLTVRGTLPSWLYI